MAKFDAGAKKTIGIMGGLIAFAAIVVIGSVTYMKITVSEADSNASVPTALGGDESKPLAGSDSDYNERLKKADKDAAAKAKDEGKTYIPLSAGAEEDVSVNRPGTATGAGTPVAQYPSQAQAHAASAPVAATSTIASRTGSGVAAAGSIGNRPVAATTSAAVPQSTTGAIVAIQQGAQASGNGTGSGSKPGDFSIPSFPPDPNAPPPIQQPQAQPAGVVAAQAGVQVDPNQRSVVLDQIYDQEQKKRAAEIADARMKAKMTRVIQIAEYLAKNDEFSPIKPSGSWIKDTPAPAASAPVSSPAETQTLAKANEVMMIKSGEKVYVNIETAIDTDEPSKVLGQVLSGKARGWPIFGKATQNPNYTVSLTFDKIVLPNGKAVPIDAMAIDPNTGRTSVQGTVDHKIFDRFVLPMVAGGLGAYGDLMSKVGTTTTVNGTITTVSNNMDMAQVRNAAMGSGVKTVASNITSESAKAKPSTSTKMNLGIEVIFMQEVMMQQ